MQLFTSHKNNIFGLSIILFLILEALLLLFLYNLYDDETTKHNTDVTNLLENEYHKVIKSFTANAALVIEEKILEEDILLLMKEANSADSLRREEIRKIIYDKLTSTYQNMNLYAYKQLQFHLPDNTSFLRFHSYEKWGDNLTGYRKTVENANSRREKTIGFEKGRIFNGYRIVYPIIYKNEHLGSVETSVSDSSIVSYIERDNDLICNFIVLAEEIKKKIFTEELVNYDPSSISPRFLYNINLNKKFKSKIAKTKLPYKIILDDIHEQEIQNKINSFDKFSFSTFTKGNYIVTFLPIKDYTDTYVAYLISFRDDEFIGKVRSRVIVFFLTGTFIFVVIVSYFSNVFVSRMEAREYAELLKKKNEELEKIKNDLLEREGLFKEMFDKHSAIQLIVDPSSKGKITDANEAALNYYGYNRDELIGQGIDFINSMNDKQVFYRMNQVVNGESRKFQVRHKLKSGELRDVEIFSTPINYKNKLLIYSIIQDVTEFVKAQKALNKSDFILKQLSENVPGNIYQYRMYPDGKSSFPFASSGIYDVYEVHPEDVKDDASLAFSRLHPEDFDEIVRKILYSRDNLTMWDDEYRVILPEKGVRWLRGTAKPEKLEDGSVLWYGYIRDITNTKLLSLKLKESEENFRNVFESMDDLIFVTNKDGEMIFVNSAVSRKLKYSKEELYGLHLLEVHRAEDKQTAEKVFVEMVKGQREYCPLPLQAKDGSLIPVETRIWFGKWNGKDVIFGISKDLTTLQAALEKFNKIFENNPALMVVTRISDNVITEVNNAFLNKLGYSKDEVIGKTSQEINAFQEPENQYHIKQQLQQFGRISDVKLKVRSKSGEMYDGLFAGEIINNQGELSFLTVMVDITERVKAENALIKANSEKDKFFSILAHDLRSPFGGLLGLINILKNEKDNLKNEDYDEIINSLDKGANRIYDLLNDLLEWSRLQRNAIQCEPKSIPVKDIVNDVVALLYQQATQKNIAIEYFEDNDEIIFADKMMITTVIRNIISNAIKFTHKNGTISIYVNRNENMTCIKIRDNGVGMSEETKNSLFRIDKSVSNAGTNNETGTGLGLIISKEFMQMNGGDITFESELNKGTIFTVTVPSV